MRKKQLTKKKDDFAEKLDQLEEKLRTSLKATLLKEESSDSDNEVFNKNNSDDEDNFFDRTKSAKRAPAQILMTH